MMVRNLVGGALLTVLVVAVPTSRADGLALGPRVRAETWVDDTASGVDVELRIGPVRIEFPWLRRLPIAPGKRLVIAITGDTGGLSLALQKIAS